MPFPETGRVIFGKNPLKEVICQLRFPTILEIGAESPARFQNRMRSAYPLYTKQEASQKLPPDISGLLEQLRLPLAGLDQSPTHRFASADDRKFISLNPEFVAVTETRYQQWESFLAEIQVAKNALEETYQPAFYSRIGLRYQDIIDREQLGLDEPWKNLINPSLIGLLGAENLSGEIQEIQTVSLITVPHVRGGLVRMRHGLRRESTDNRQVYVIDSDFHTQERSKKDDVLGILDEFRRVAGNLFRWAASSRLQQALGPTEIEQTRND